MSRAPVVIERRRAPSNTPAPSRSASSYLDRAGAPQAALPEPVALALAAIVNDMRDVPRDCLRDPAELFHWLRRMANRVEGVGRMQVPISSSRLNREKANGQRGLTSVSTPKTPGGLTRSKASPLELAEAVFGNAPKPSTKPVERRTITSRKGRAVPVEVRRARAAGQMELL